MLSVKEDKNYYEVLEVSSDATPDEVYEGYIRAKNAYGQDSLALYSLMSKDECQSVLTLIDEAYSIISDPNKRQQYDNARGITKTYSKTPHIGIVNHDPNAPRPTGEFNEGRSSIPSEKKVPVPTQNNITKLVATNKFSLNYETSPDFEQKIEKETEYTGEFLRQIREYKNVDIPRMAEMTKVSKTYIKNIEVEEVDKLPALVYVRGFVYQYAKCLKLNPELVANSYLNRLKKLKGS